VADRIKPFQATHYNPSVFKGLKKLVCPPYDVISKEEQKKLKKSSPYNFCHILLRSNNDSYQDLGKKFNRWLEDNILVEDKGPAIYVTLQEFTVNSKKYKRRGFLALLRLDEEKVTFPHERTHSKPKKDRLQVISRVKANLSPIFIIYPKKNKEPIKAMIEGLKDSKPFLKVADHERVSYKVWKLTDKRDIEKITKYFNNIPLLIADGHHRFEVARKFLKRNKNKSFRFTDLNYILAYFSPQDENLLIFPTHRVLKKKLDLDLLPEKLRPYFFVVRHKNLKDLEDSLKKKRQFCFGFYQDKNFLSLSLKEETSLDKILKKSSVYKNLDIFLLHNWIFGSILKMKIKEDEIVYTKSIKDAKNLADMHKGCAFIIRPPKIEDVMDAAFKSLKLPQKTTYFYPKFLSGLILRKL